MITDKLKKLNEIKKEVNCPLKAMSVDGSELVCNCPSALYNKVGRVSLGSIREDILDNCGSCKEKMSTIKDIGDPKEYAKMVEIDECHEVECQADGNNKVSAIDSCRECVFFRKEMFKKQMEEAGPDAEMKFIPCGYPLMDKDSMKVFLERKTRKKNTVKTDVLPEQAAASD